MGLVGQLLTLDEMLSLRPEELDVLETLIAGELMRNTDIHEILQKKLDEHYLAASRLGRKSKKSSPDKTEDS